MTQMNLSMKHNRGLRGETGHCHGGGWVREGWTESLGFADANWYILNG